MLTVYRRHLAACPHAKKGRSWRRCACPVWVAGTIAGQKIKQSMNLTSLEAATEKIREWERAGKALADGERPAMDSITVNGAIEKFMTDARARNLTEASIKKYRVLLQRPETEDPNKERARSLTLEEFASEKGISKLADLNTDLLREFRAGWVDGPLAGQKKLERMKAFFRHAADSGWVPNNQAKTIKAPVRKADVPTLPLSDEEIEKLHKGIPAFRTSRAAHGPAIGSDHVDRLAVLLRVMEYSGLRIGDACKISEDDLDGNKLFLDTQKSGTRVYVPLPAWLVEEMKKLRRHGGRFFSTGEGKIGTVAGNYRRTLRDLAQEAGMEDVHPHRLRDTFAVRLLREGVPVERVSKLLGHQSVAITERHYSPWVRALQ